MALRTLRRLETSFWPAAAAGVGLLVWQTSVWLFYPWDRPFPYWDHAPWLVAALLLVGDGLLRLLSWLRTQCSARARRIGSRLGIAVAGLGTLGVVGTYVWAEVQVARLASKPIRTASCSRAFLDATVAMEDGRFYRHRGLDLEAIHRALRRNVQARRIVQGGSTITQQLAKNVFLGPERALRRKILEAYLALALERRLTKRRILSMYVSCVDYGLGCRGIEQAAGVYFGKRPEELDLAESAILVGLVPSPPRRYLTSEDLNRGRLKALGRVAYFFGNRYTDSQLAEAARRPLAGWVLPYVDAAGRGATATVPATVSGVRFFYYSAPTRPTPLRHLHPSFADRLRAFARYAHAKVGLRGIAHIGAYVDRLQRGDTETLSAHALGRALDIRGFLFQEGHLVEARASQDVYSDHKLTEARQALQRFFPRVLWYGNEPRRHHDHIHIELPAPASALSDMFTPGSGRDGVPAVQDVGHRGRHGRDGVLAVRNLGHRGR